MNQQKLPGPVPLPARSIDSKATPNPKESLNDSIKHEAMAALKTSQGLFKEMMADMPPKTTKLPDAARIEKYIDAVAGHVSTGKYAQLGSCMAATKPALMLLIRMYLLVSPYFGWLFKWGYRIYTVLPKNVLQMIFGVALCYFGGTYVASIALIEAFRTMGFQRCVDDVRVIYEQVQGTRVIHLAAGGVAELSDSSAPVVGEARKRAERDR